MKERITPADNVSTTKRETTTIVRERTGDPFGLMGRHWKTIAGAAVAGMLVAWVVAAMQPDRYRASVLAAVAPVAEALDPSELLRGVEVLEQRTVVATVAALAKAPSTAAQALGENAGYSIDAAVLPNTNLVRVDVEGANAARATEIANRVPALLGQQARNMFKVYGVTPVSPATQPAEAISPHAGRAVAAGLLIGLILGAVIAYAMEKSRNAAKPVQV